MFSILTLPSGISFQVHVQPGASRNQILGLHGDALKLKLTAPPVEGRANKACIEFLSDVLNVPKSGLEIVMGQSNRLKRIRITCPPTEFPRLRARLMELVSTHPSSAAR
jgi:uncharacterized protein (TIGR00251 family)